MNTRILRCLCSIALVSCFSLVLAGSALAAKERQPFGIASFTMQPTHTVERVEGEARIFENVPYSFSQAGGHPWALTTTFQFDSEELPNGGLPDIVPTQDPKDIIVNLPPGLLGDPMAVPRCSLTRLLGGSGELCPVDTQVGVFRIHWFGEKEILGPIVDVTPEAGQSAEFALENTQKIPFLETAHLVRTKQGYGFTVVSNNVPTVELNEVEETFWGVPADPSHNPMRGLFCAKLTSKYPLCQAHSEYGGEEGGASAGTAPVPFLTWTTDCAAGPEFGAARADSWESPGHVGDNQQYEGFVEATPALFPIATGCDLLKFEPQIELQPDTTTADEPVALGVNVKVPQVETEALATPQLRDAVVTLPEGMSVSPGVVDGIHACEATGPEGINIEGPESEKVGANGELQLAPGHCPNASLVGEAEAITPLLPIPVKGRVFLAKPGCGGAGESPCTEQDALDGNLYKLYLELGGEGKLADTGVEIKVAGETEANPATGQLTTKFLESPQAPFSELRIRLNGGPRAPIANPAVCGEATTTADFTPWSAPGTTPAPESQLVSGTPDATPFSFYNVTGCTAPVPFSPGFVAGNVTPQAGQYSSFTVNMSRQDREQFVKGIQIHTPPGLLGMLSNVQLCDEAEADDGHCPEASKIGTTRVASGAGSHPFEIEGSVYLTGPYGGAPFGLSIVTNAVAGPFHLGLVIVRARIEVNPENSTLTVTTDETGPFALPQIIFGVPLRLKRITVNIDRPQFMFNPTSCAAQQITAVISGSDNATSTVSSPFAVGGCKSLAFKPKFTVSTSAHTSRTMGASLDARLSYPAGALANDANIARVKVDLPRQLPSRLTTLQKACTAAQFDTNPAGCPAASNVGIAKATTPLLPVGLSGPVYFVSHGGEAFPSLVVVLQGDNVRVDLIGSTFISKAGITSSTFKTVPDVPVNTFELFLPQGNYSTLAANGNLCKSENKLKMPTEFVAQNGAVVNQNTQIQVTGCGTGAKTSRRATQAKRKGHSARAHTGTAADSRASK